MRGEPGSSTATASRLEPSAYAGARPGLRFRSLSSRRGPLDVPAVRGDDARQGAGDRLRSWGPPLGPLELASIRVPEREVGAIPDLLRSRRARAAEMGEAARAAWLDWFSPEAGFHRTVEWCLELDRAGARSGQWRRLAPRVQMCARTTLHASWPRALGTAHRSTPETVSQPWTHVLHC